MLGCNESNIIFQQHLCKLGQLRRSNGRNHKYSVGLRKKVMPHFRTFCELVEGEENKLTTFSTWTTMLGCNESNIIFQQHLCKLGQLRRSNGRNSQVLGQAMKKRPTGHYKKYSHFKGRDTAPTSRVGSCIVDSSTSGGENAGYIPRWGGWGARSTRAILSRDRTEDDDVCVCVEADLELWLYISDCSDPLPTSIPTPTLGLSFLPEPLQR